MTLDVRSVRLVLLFDLLGGGRIERAVGLLVRMLEPLLRPLGVYSALLYPDGRPRRVGTIEELAHVVPCEVIEQKVREEFVSYLAEVPPESPWQPALSFAGIVLEHARRLGTVANALRATADAPVVVVMRPGTRSSLLRRLLLSDPSNSARSIKVVDLLPRMWGRALSQNALQFTTAASLVPSEGSVVMVAQSRAIGQTLNAVATQLGMGDPELSIAMLDEDQWSALIGVTGSSGPVKSVGEPPAPLRRVLDGAALVEAVAAARAVVRAADLFVRLRPRALIVGNDRFGIGAVATAAARRARIPALLVQDGLAADIPVWWNCAADIVCSCGDQLPDILSRIGHRTRTVIVVGQPRSHGVEAMQRRLADRLEPAHAVRHRVLVALQDGHGEDYCGALLTHIAGFASGQDVQCEVNVRMHPHFDERVRRYVTHFAVQQGWTIDHSPSIVDALASATIVVGEYSTVLAEAVLAGIPAASFEPSLGPIPISLSGYGVTLAFSSVEELRAICLRSEREIADQLVHAQRQATYLLGSIEASAPARIAEVVSAAFQPV